MGTSGPFPGAETALVLYL